MNHRESHTTGAIALLLAMCSASFAAPIIRLAGGAGADPMAIAAIRMLCAAAIIAPVALTRGRAGLSRIGRREWPILIGAGIFLGLHIATWVASLSYTSVASSVLLVTMQPVFIPILAWLFLRERVGGWGILGIAAAICGAAVIAIFDRGVGETNLTGDLLALVGSLSAAFYVLAGRGLRNRLPLIAYVWPVYGIAAIALLITGLVMRVPMLGLPAMAYLWILALAIVAQVIAHTLINLAARHLPGYMVAVGLLGEAIGATILAYFLLHEAPARGFYFGAPLIFAGIAIVLSRRPQAGEEPPAG